MLSKRIVILLATALMLVSCSSGSPNESTSEKPDYSNFDIIINNLSKAKSLFIGEKNTDATSTTVTNVTNEKTETLFLLTEDGYVEEVKYSYVIVKTIYDGEGNVIGEEFEEKEEAHFNSPRSIKKINDKYLMVNFKNYPNESGFNYLVNQQNGRCYKMPLSFTLQSTICNDYDFGDVVPDRELFMTDNENSVYFMASESGNSATYGLSYPIKKLDLTDPNNITAKTVSLKDDNVDFNSMPAVSKNGSIAYWGKNNSSSISRYIKKDGSFSNLGIDNWSTDFWTGYDGNIYCCKDSHIYRIVENDDDISFEQYGTNELSGFGMAFYYAKNGNEGRVYLDNQKKIIKFGTNEMTEIYNEETNEVTNISFASIGLKRPKIHASSDNYIYTYGADSENNSVLCRIDAENEYQKTILMRNKYDLSYFTVDENETITFSGLRFTDGAYVVGTIDSHGKETIANISFNTEVESLINL